MLVTVPRTQAGSVTSGTSDWRTNTARPVSRPSARQSRATSRVLWRSAREPGEQRLFRSGKLPGLFPGRGGPSAEAATRALHEGLLEVVRTEAKGKTSTEWVRLTPRGVDFLHDHESPARVLEELRQVLQAS